VEELGDQYKFGGFAAHPKPPSPQTNLQNQSSKYDFALVSLFLKDPPCIGLQTDKKENEIFPHILGNSDGIGCKVINEEELPNI
jgi:hypothetical protein